MDLYFTLLNTTIRCMGIAEGEEPDYDCGAVQGGGGRMVYKTADRKGSWK
jgi:hypothetical protein